MRIQAGVLSANVVSKSETHALLSALKPDMEYCRESTERKMKQLRLYIDTSVFGGCFDDEFSEESKRLLETTSSGHVVFLVSEVVLAELRRAPQNVQNLFQTIPDEALELLDKSPETVALSQAYLAARVVTAKSRNDAEHVAYATVARADAIVSWNFKHIVRLDRIKGFNKVNFENGYGVLQIVSPKEVLFGEN